MLIFVNRIRNHQFSDLKREEDKEEFIKQKLSEIKKKYDISTTYVPLPLSSPRVEVVPSVVDSLFDSIKGFKDDYIDTKVIISLYAFSTYFIGSKEKSVITSTDTYR